MSGRSLLLMQSKTEKKHCLLALCDRLLTATRQQEQHSSESKSRRDRALFEALLHSSKWAPHFQLAALQ